MTQFEHYVILETRRIQIEAFGDIILENLKLEGRVLIL